MHDILRKRLYEKAGLIEKEKMRSLAELRKTEWSDKFEELMRNRLLMGAFRYGTLDRMDTTNYDAVGSMISRLKKYQDTGNTEHLVDVANICLCVFVRGKHPNKHFASIDDGEHVKEK